MSLDWDSTACTPVEAANEEEAATRKCLVFESLCVNLNEITEANEDEWMLRSMLLQRCDLSTIMYGTEDWDEKANFLRAALRRWRGLTTNVSHKERAGWLKSVGEYLCKEVERRLPADSAAD